MKVDPSTIYPSEVTASGAMLSGVFVLIAIILAIAVTVLAFIFIIPEKRRKNLGSFGKFLHDTCNFKYLVVEKLLQALYVFSTAFVILNGFFTLFGGDTGILVGILMMIVGPIVIRLVYELMMMLILLVKNVISINGKLKFSKEEE